MNNNTHLFLVLILLVCVTATPGAAGTGDAREIDPYSYSLGGLNVWAEVVAIGIKKLALSSALSPDEMDALEAGSQPIMSERKGVKLYRETDFMVTDLFPASATDGKHVLLIYKGSTLDEYMAVKQRKAALVSSGTYTGKAREEIAWTMGKLLSYPDGRIRELMSNNVSAGE